jgi:hypothetical protein
MDDPKVLTSADILATARELSSVVTARELRCHELGKGILKMAFAAPPDEYADQRLPLFGVPIVVDNTLPYNELRFEMTDGTVRRFTIEVPMPKMLLEWRP